LAIAASIFARLRTIEASSSSRSTGERPPESLPLAQDRQP